MKSSRLSRLLCIRRSRTLRKPGSPIQSAFQAITSVSRKKLRATRNEALNAGAIMVEIARTS